jgi:hypothetical protein
MEPQNSSTLTPAEFARSAGLTLQYVYSLLAAGRLEASKTDGVWAISAAELERRKAVAL